MNLQDFAIGAVCGLMVSIIVGAVGFLAFRPKGRPVVILQPHVLIITQGRFIGVKIISRSTSPTTITSVLFALDGGHFEKIGLSYVERSDGRVRINRPLNEHRLEAGEFIDACVNLDAFSTDKEAMPFLRRARKGWIELEHTMSDAVVRAEVQDFDLFEKWLAKVESVQPGAADPDIPF